MSESDPRMVAGRYRLRSVAGRGGMGLVWFAQDELLDRPVALKEVLPDDAVSERSRRGALARALAEARTATRVDHHGVVRVHDLVKQDGLPWIVMELLSGRTLAEALRADGPFPVEQVTRIGVCLLAALQATHRAGVVHRDVKPGNVFLCGNGRVVLTDFGIACRVGDDEGDAAEAFAGSPGYTSPERVRGEPPRPASDLFSLGATLFAAVEGRSPFSREDVVATMIAVTHDSPPPLRRGGPLREVLDGLLAKDPRRRPDAEQARAALVAVGRRYGGGAQGLVPHGFPAGGDAWPGSLGHR